MFIQFARTRNKTMQEKQKLLELVKQIKREPSNDKKWELLIKWLDILMTKLQGSKLGNKKTVVKGSVWEYLKTLV